MSKERKGKSDKVEKSLPESLEISEIYAKDLNKILTAKHFREKWAMT